MKNSQDCNRVHPPLYEKFISRVHDWLISKSAQDNEVKLKYSSTGLNGFLLE